MFRVMAFSITILWTFILELLGMKVLVHRIPYQRIATGSMIWNLDMKLTEVEGINHLFELFEINFDLMKQGYGHVDDNNNITRVFQYLVILRQLLDELIQLRT
eukprot:78669_1